MRADIDWFKRLDRLALETIARSCLGLGWMVRLVSRDLAATRVLESAPNAVDTALSSYQRLGLALRCGLGRDAACLRAARTGCVDALCWMRRWWPPEKWSDDLYEAAAVGGHIAVLQWLRRETPCVWTLESMEAVARVGRMEVFLYRVDGTRAVSDDRGTRAFIDRQVLHRLHDVRPWTQLLAAAAVLRGRVDWLTTLHKTPYHAEPRTCALAAARGHLNVMRWQLAHGVARHPHTLVYAAQHGQTDTLKWAMSHGWVWHQDAATGAASYGRIEVLKWVCFQRLPVDVAACQAASKKPRVLKWLAANY